jgi:hypothetical protein
MHFLSSRGYGENIDWELGNGSTYLWTLVSNVAVYEQNISPERIVKHCF